MLTIDRRDLYRDLGHVSFYVTLEQCFIFTFIKYAAAQLLQYLMNKWMTFDLMILPGEHSHGFYSDETNLTSP